MLGPKTDAEKIVRIRPGLLGVRGPMDVALERIELQTNRGLVCRQLEAFYERGANEREYVAEFSFEAPPMDTDNLNLVLTKEQRPIQVAMPFIVRDLPVPALGHK
jgi:hypothetical protein